VKEGNKEVIQKLEAAIHRASTQTKLLRLENEGLLASPDTKNKRTKHRRRLPLQGGKTQPTNGVLYSPRKLAQAQAEITRKDAEKIAEKARKKTVKELSKAKKALAEKVLEEKRIERERLKVVKEKEKADKAAEAQRKKQESDYQKAIQTSQRGKRKASRPPPKQQKRQKVSSGGAIGGRSLDRPQPAASPQPTRTTRLGRNVTLPSKFR
jgi:hypothetical protein